MGKQSARIYYQGQDHCDVAFADNNGNMHNHSKIYKGSTLLWKREKPKYLFLFTGGGIPINSTICTSEALQTLSAFMACPDNMRYIDTYEDHSKSFGAFVDVAYAFERFFAILGIGTRINNGSAFSYEYYICYSDDGYEWKKIKEITFNDEPIAIRRYLYSTTEVLVIVCTHSILYMDENFQTETVYETSNRSFTTTIVTKRDTFLICNSYYSTFYVGNGKSWRTYALSSPVYGFSNASSEGYFYTISYNQSQFSWNILRSYDGVNWSEWLIFDERPDVFKMYVVQNYLYLPGISDGHLEFTRINLGTKQMEKKVFQGKDNISSGYFFVAKDCIFGQMQEQNTQRLYYAKWKDPFNDDLEPENVRVSCQFYAPGAFNYLVNGVSTDYDIVV